jgi:signal peptidase II
LSQAFRGRGLVFAIAALVVLADQASKALVLRYLAVNEAWAPIPDLSHLFTITHVTNTGAAFGLFQDRGMLFMIIAVVVVVAIVAYYRYLPTEHVLVRVSLGLQLGGALGNLVDRLRFGHVIAFFDFKFWPVFNIADASLFVGVLILAYYLLREGEGGDPQPAGGQADGPPEMAAPPLTSDPGESD